MCSQAWVLVIVLTMFVSIIVVLWLWANELADTAQESLLREIELRRVMGLAIIDLERRGDPLDFSLARLLRRALKEGEADGSASIG